MSSKEPKADLDQLADHVEKLNLKEHNPEDNNNNKKNTKDDDFKGIPEDVRKVGEWIKNSNKIMILTGAGVSVAAGIPDFRTPGTGLYDNLQKYNLPYAEAIFDVDFYRDTPQPFLRLAKELWPGLKYSPTLTHSFVAVLGKHNKLLRNYSQNIDGLEFLAEISKNQLVECHGHFRTAACIKCHKPFDGDKCKQIILETDDIPTCPKCGGYVKPDIVFFGESLPARFHTLLRKDVVEADLLLVMGTSLMVAPVSMIPKFVHEGCKRVLMNRERVGNFDRSAERDIVLLGDCDETAKQLARYLGWAEELYEQNKKTKIVPEETESKE